MAIHLRRPPDTHLRTLLTSAAGDDLTYAPAGVSLTGPTPPMLRRHCWTTELPTGSFETAAAAISSWQTHRGSGLIVEAEGEVARGVNVAMLAPLPRGWVDVTCRVVEIVDEPDRRGFAYGTLSIHPERGEESFVVTRDDDGAVSFEVVAVSAPVHPLARMGGPITDRLQGRAVRRYLTAMRAIVAA